MNKNFLIYAFLIVVLSFNAFSIPSDWCILLNDTGTPSYWCVTNNSKQQFYNLSSIMIYNDSVLNSKIDNLNNSGSGLYYSIANGDNLALNISNVNISLNNKIDNLNFTTIKNSGVNNVTGTYAFNGLLDVFSPTRFFNDVNITNINEFLVNQTIMVTDVSGVNKILLNGSGDSYFNNGNVGIGLNNPSAKLVIAGNASNILMRLHQDALGGNATIRLRSTTTSGNNFHSDIFTASTSASSETGYLGFRVPYTATSPQMIIDTNGRVGIGTTSPTSTLYVQGTSTINSTLVLTNGLTDSGSLQMGASDLVLNGTSGTYTFWGYSGGYIPLLSIDDDKRLGVNILNPSGTMHINDSGITSAVNPTLKLSRSLSAIGAGHGIVFTNSNVNNNMAYIMLTTDPVGNQGELAFGTATSTTTNSSERMRIDNSGNIGIGTTIPNSILDIVQSQDSNTLARINNSNVGTSARASLAVTANSGSISLIQASQNFNAVPAWSNDSIIAFGGQDLWIHGTNANNPNIIFALNTSSSTGEKMRLTSQGNLGLGLTNPDSRLAIYGSSVNITIDNDLETASGLTIWDAQDRTQRGDFLYDSGTNRVIIRNNNGNFYYMDVQGSQFFDTDVLMINATSNFVGIGTTSPTDKLTISASNQQLRLVDVDDGNFTQFSYSTDQLAIRMNSVSATPTFIATDTNKLFINMSAGSDYTQTLTVGGSANITGLFFTQKSIASSSCSVAIEGSIFYNTTLKKHMGCNSTSWVALW